MKTSLGWCRWGALLAMPVLVARADGTASKPTPVTTLHTSATDISSSETSVAAPATPPDGVEFSTADPEVIAAQTMEIKAEQRENQTAAPPAWETDEEQQQQAAARDWMLRDYTARLKNEGLARTSATDPSIFSQPATTASSTATAPSANDDPLLDSLNPPQPEPAAANPLPAPSDAKSELNSSSLPSITSLTPLQPLLPPLNSPALNAPRDAWGTEPVAVTPTDMAPPLPIANDNARNSSSLDVPGLTAAESGLGPAPSDLSFQDPLPDKPDNRPGRLAGENNFLAPTAPSSDVSEFFRKQALALKPPTAPTAVQPLTVPAKPVQHVQPERLAKPAISGLRSHVDDPFDILRQ